MNRISDYTARAVESIHCFFDPDYKYKAVGKQANEMLTALAFAPQTTDCENIAPTIKQWRKLVNSCSGNQRLDSLLRDIDSLIHKIRPDIAVQHAKNRSLERKWQSYGFDQEIFDLHPDFVDFLFDSSLASQMKVVRDDYKPRLIDGEPAILVEGKWMKWKELKEAFSFDYSPRYEETFVKHKETADVYTFLDNGQGLQKYHPYNIDSLVPVSSLNDEEYEKALQLGQNFIREGEGAIEQSEREERNKDRKYIVQVVSSYQKTKVPSFLRAIVNPDFVLGPQHTYLRIIAGEDVEIGEGENIQRLKKGDVFEVGYTWKKRPVLPFMSIQGMFRGPDIWEYVPSDERVVTNIALTRKETKKLYKFVKRVHSDNRNFGKEPAFHMGQQNCTVFVRKALAEANPDIYVPTEISWKKLFKKISPEWVNTLGKIHSNLHPGRQYSPALRQRIKALSPYCVRHTAELISSVVSRSLRFFGAVAAIPVNLGLGNAIGDGGVSFEEGKQIKPPLQDIHYMTDTKKQKFNMPGVTQKWQKGKQKAATQIFVNPRKLAIVKLEEQAK